MTIAYEEDVAAWALEQVALLRSGQWALLDVEHIVEEIEDMNAGLTDLPKTRLWSFEQVLADDYLPS
jgi:hypothetical protein